MNITAKMIFTLFSFALIGQSTGQSVETEYRKDEFLSISNYLRRSVVPLASNMHELTWDDDLAQKAAASAALCRPDHTENIDYYQNLIASGSNNVTVLLMYYFMERDYFDYDNPEMNDFEKTGHYQIMAKGAMTKIGCAITKGKCPNTGKYVTFCNYKSERLQAENSIYLSQKPCTQCSASYSFCNDGLCVKKSSSCKKICRYCGYLYDVDCRCYCNPGFLSSPDCSVMDPGEGMGSCQNCVSHTPVHRKLCDNGGTIKAPTCGKNCDCPTGFSGRWCQYNVDEHKKGVMLTFHWSQIWVGSQVAYFPMNIEQGKTIVKKISSIIAKKVGSKADNVAIGSGYPELDNTGKLRILILVTGNIGQGKLLSGLQSARDKMQGVVGAATGTTLDKIETESK